MPRRLLLCCLFALSLGWGLAARDIRVSVGDADLDLPLAGATVQGPDGSVAKTDADGLAVVRAPDGQACVVRIAYPGYQLAKVEVKADQSVVRVKLAPQGAVGSSELVVEGRREQSGGSRPGVAAKLDRQELRSTSQIGLVEDVMSSIKTLPGVGYTGGFNALPSIRGGEPQELTAVLDGFMVDKPFHWGGAYSIFHPNMVKSATLSDGIFPARYGYATSGLLEVESRDPEPEAFRCELGITTSSADLLASLPGKGGDGLIFAASATYYDPIVAAVGLFAPALTQTIYRAPFIRDFSLRGSWHLDPKLIVYVNGFFGCDGIGVKADNFAGGSGIKYNFNLLWNNYLAFLSTGLKWQADERSYVHFMVGGGWSSSQSDSGASQSGSRDYSQAFLDWYHANVGPLAAGSYAVYQSTHGVSASNDYNIQTRLDGDFRLADWLGLQIGATEMVQFWLQDSHGTYLGDDGTNHLTPIAYSITTDGNVAYNSGAYLSASAKSGDGGLALDAGLRVDHLYLGGKNGFGLQSLPVLNPRALLSWRPVRENAGVESLTLSLGTGLFSRPPDELSAINASYGIGDLQLKPNQVWTSLVGADLELDGGWKIQLEGYYKDVFNRFYYNYVQNAGVLDIRPHFDGQAQIWGVDLMLQKYQSRYVDGWLSASYSYARYRNPTVDANAVDPQTRGHSSATGDWFWPDFHRFVTANLVLNIKPSAGFTITAHVAFATGKPMKSVGAVYPGYLLDGTTVIEQWKRAEYYSDSGRTEPSIPIDLRLAWNWYDRDSRVATEFYIAAENILVNLYSPKSRPMIDPYTGQELSGSGNADFNLGFPMISFGFKWSY